MASSEILGLKSLNKGGSVKRKRDHLSNDKQDEDEQVAKRHHRHSTMLDCLQQNGFVVIPNVLSGAETQELKDMMWGWLGSLELGGQKITHDDPSTWANKHWPDSSHGILQHYNVGHSDFMWKLRQHPKVLEIFAALHKCKVTDLLSSFDGACVYRPPELVKGMRWRDTEKLWLHVDQGSRLRGFQCIQGLVTLNDMDTDDCTLHVLTGSHLQHDQLMERLAQRYPARHKKGVFKKNWIKLPDAELAWLRDAGFIDKYITAPAGSLVLWDSRLVHANCRPTKTRLHKNRWRFVQYVSYQPRTCATEAQLKKKRQAFLTARTTSHWAVPVKLNGLRPQFF
jgi:hypothetical protein